MKISVCVPMMSVLFSHKIPTLCQTIYISVLCFGILAFLILLSPKIKGTNGQVTRADILQVGLRELLNALFSNPVDDNLICAVKLLKVGFTFLSLKCHCSTPLMYHLEKVLLL